MKESVLKKRVAKSLEPKKSENTLESYLAQNLSKDMWWKQGGNFKDPENTYKKEFLEKDVKATHVMPQEMKRSSEFPDNFGYFDSKFGTISVGYKKFGSDPSVAFSLVPEKTKVQQSIPERKEDSPNTYFGGEMKGRKKFFKVSKLSFKYNPETEEIQKIEKDNDKIIDTEENLLYEDEKELEKIEDLQRLKRGASPDVRSNISKEMENLREIRSEEQEDNAELLREIRNFIKKMKKDTLRKIIDSDESISRRSRTSGLYDDMIILRNLIKKLLEEIYGSGYKPDDFELEKLSKKELENLIKKLKSKMD